MTDRAVVGTAPWLPGPLGRSPWWAAPVPAERLAALRISLAAVLLLDILVQYLPHLADFFAPGGLAGTADAAVAAGHWTVRLAGGLDRPAVMWGLGLAWAVAAAALLVGWWSRTSAAAAWALSLLFWSLNPHVHNAGDTVRITVLFYLLLSPCGAAWSVDAWLRPDQIGHAVHPWPLRLLFVQMAVIYFYNGVHKALGPQWLAGESLHYVLSDLALTRVSAAWWPLPDAAMRALTWVVLVWELAFPLLVMSPWLRPIALLMGVAFHVGLGLTLELGAFAPYMLCLYAPLVPWERWPGCSQVSAVTWPRRLGREGEAPAEPDAVTPRGPSPPTDAYRPGSAGASPSRPNASISRTAS